jgi:nucleotide-binding universal stress UspA family protein
VSISGKKDGTRAAFTASSPLGHPCGDNLGGKGKAMEIRRILVPIDGSELSLKAAEAAAALAARFGASMILLTVAEPPEAMSAYVSGYALEEARRGLARGAESILAGAAERVRPVLPGVDARVVWGSPAAAIAEEAEKGYDLVVMGSRGLGLEPIDRHLLGSVAERVLRRTERPVLIIPGEEKS